MVKLSKGKWDGEVRFLHTLYVAYILFILYFAGIKSVRLCNWKSKLFKVRFNSSYGKMTHSVLTEMSKLLPEWVERINM